MNRHTLILIVLLIAAATVAVALGRDTALIALVDKEGKRTRLSVEIADTPEDRAEGLMYRQSLGRFDGMLFVVPQPQIMRFWMKNTLLPLDVVFFDAEGEFVSSVSMLPCANDPCPVYESQAQAIYGLELPAGYVKEHGVRVGWKMEW